MSHPLQQPSSSSSTSLKRSLLLNRSLQKLQQIMQNCNGFNFEESSQYDYRKRYEKIHHQENNKKLKQKKRIKLGAKTAAIDDETQNDGMVITTQNTTATDIFDLGNKQTDFMRKLNKVNGMVKGIMGRGQGSIEKRRSLDMRKLHEFGIKSRGESYSRNNRMMTEPRENAKQGKQEKGIIRFKKKKGGIMSENRNRTEPCLMLTEPSEMVAVERHEQNPQENQVLAREGNYNSNETAHSSSLPAVIDKRKSMRKAKTSLRKKKQTENLKQKQNKTEANPEQQDQTDFCRLPKLISRYQDAHNPQNASSSEKYREVNFLGIKADFAKDSDRKGDQNKYPSYFEVMRQKRREDHYRRIAVISKIIRENVVRENIAMADRNKYKNRNEKVGLTFKECLTRKG